MGDMGDDFRAMNQARKEHHAAWKESNTKIIESSGIPYLARPESLLFREEGKPKVDFYPSTGRWRVAGVKRTFSGGAKSFLGWYRKQYNDR